MGVGALKCAAVHPVHDVMHQWMPGTINNMKGPQLRDWDVTTERLFVLDVGETRNRINNSPDTK